MAIVTAPNTSRDGWTAADLVERFGPIPLRRIRMEPPPGMASEQDVVEIHEREDRLYELVDGVLVEKTVGMQESYLAVWIAKLLIEFVEANDLGFALGSDGMTRLFPGLVRIPDVSFVSWDHFPDRKVPSAPMLGFAPDLAVEVLSPSNTAKEMERKLRDYFEAGVRLVWYVDPRGRTVRVYLSPSDERLLDRAESALTGEPVLPGFSVALGELFSRIG